MGDLERVLGEAQRAREEAEAAAQRAADLESQAEAARERARQEREAGRRRWAQGVVDAYEADLSAAEAAIQAANERFDRAAVEDLPGAVAAYLAWGEATVRHYALQVRVGTAAPLLDLEASPAAVVAPPPFSGALDRALARRIAELSDRARDEAAAEIGRELDDGHAAPGAPVGTG